MDNQHENNKRIARNTLFLYLRMILIMGVSLFTSRVILRALGEVDFGLYNVVGGIIVIFSFMTNSMASTASRYIAVALGTGDKIELQKVTSTTRLIQIFLAAVILILAETLGLWLLLHKFVIPPERVTAAFWVYQCSVLTTVISILSSPYNALIIAHEQMKAFAYISLFEAVAKFLIAYSLLYAHSDKLIIYAILLLALQLFIRICYLIYCRRHFPEVNVRLSFEKHRFKEMFAYSGWTSLEFLAVAGYTQGLNVLLNIFFGPVVNAANAIAVQVQGAVNRFISSFQMALNPQITKSYASNNFDYMHKLVLYGSKYAFFLMLILGYPVFINVEYILTLWLGNVPQHTVVFVRLMLIISLVGSLRNSLHPALHATGRIRKVQIIETITLLMIVPVSYAILKDGVRSPEVVFYVFLIIKIIAYAFYVYYILPMIKMKISTYLRIVVWPIVLIVIIMGVLFVMCSPKMDIVYLINSSLSSVCVVLFLIFCLGLRNEERRFLKVQVSNFYHKLKKH